MLANGVKETTATIGTGTISLGGASSGFIPFSAVYATGQAVMYAVEDGNNRETGVGLLTSGSPWTLTRSLVLDKLEGGTYTRSPATALNLSGSATVMVAASAQTQMQPPVGKWQNGNWNSGVWPSGYSSGGANRYISPHHSGNNNTTQTANRMMLGAFQAPTSFAATKAFFVVGTAAAGGTKARVGIYGLNELGGPGPLLSQTDDVAVDSTGAKSGTLNTPLAFNGGDWVWVGLLTNGAPGISSHNTFNGISAAGWKGGISEAYVNRMLMMVSVSSGWTSMPTNIREDAGGWDGNVPSIALGTN